MNRTCVLVLFWLLFSFHILIERVCTSWMPIKFNHFYGLLNIQLDQSLLINVKLVYLCSRKFISIPWRIKNKKWNKYEIIELGKCSNWMIRRCIFHKVDQLFASIRDCSSRMRRYIHYALCIYSCLNSKSPCIKVNESWEHFEWIVF